MLRIVYTLVLIICVPILLVFFLPCAAAYRGGKMVDECLLAWHDKSNNIDDFNAQGDSEWKDMS